MLCFDPSLPASRGWSPHGPFAVALVLSSDRFAAAVAQHTRGGLVIVHVSEQAFSKEALWSRTLGLCSAFGLRAIHVRPDDYRHVTVDPRLAAKVATIDPRQHAMSPPLSSDLQADAAMLAASVAARLEPGKAPEDWRAAYRERQAEEERRAAWERFRSRFL
jgi:hypothetical protein